MLATSIKAEMKAGHHFLSENHSRRLPYLDLHPAAFLCCQRSRIPPLPQQELSNILDLIMDDNKTPFLE